MLTWVVDAYIGRVTGTHLTQSNGVLSLIVGECKNWYGGAWPEPGSTISIPLTGVRAYWKER